jgi:hypothetical protein
MRNYILAAWLCLTAGFAQTAPPKHRGENVARPVVIE